MDFSFGIVANGIVFDLVINSIIKQNIPNFEIIIVGGPSVYDDYPFIKHIPFDETIKDGWITRKKNLITDNAQYENIVYMHDYFMLQEQWYKGFLEFGEDWDVCMNRVLNMDGTRFRDWCVWDDPDICYPNDKHRIMLPDYTYDNKKYMYISGGYWVAKKSLMMLHPLDENLCWGESEDVKWSKEIRYRYKYEMNTYSAVQTLKQKKLSAEYV